MATEMCCRLHLRDKITHESLKGLTGGYGICHNFSSFVSLITRSFVYSLGWGGVGRLTHDSSHITIPGLDFNVLVPNPKRVFVF